MGTGVAIAIAIASAYVGVAGAQEASGRQKMALEKAGEQKKEISDKAASALRKRTQRLIASQRVAFAKGGVILEGTPLEVMMETMEESEFDRQAILRGALFDQQATASDISAVINSGRVDAMTSALSGTSRAIQIAETKPKKKKTGAA